MTSSPATGLDLEYYPLTPDRWADLEALFGKNGAYGNCWCMWWRLSRSEFSNLSGSEKKAAFKGIVDSRQVPGLLAYTSGQPIAWCSIAPRETYPSLERSRTLKRIDNQPVWSIVCFFVAKPFRGQGLMVKLLEAAIAYAREQGAKIVEGYPVDPGEKVLAPVLSYMGTVSAFKEAGFEEVAGKTGRRPIMRYYIRHHLSS